MKFVFALCILAVAALADETIKYIPVIERTEHHDDQGQFTLRYISADGTTVDEAGVLKPTLDGKGKVLVKEGVYEFTADDGKVYRTKWVSDNLGFRAEGDHLPKAPVA